MRDKNIRISRSVEQLGVTWNEVLKEAKKLGVWAGIVEGNLWASKEAFVSVLQNRVSLKLLNRDEEQVKKLLRELNKILKA